MAKPATPPTGETWADEKPTERTGPPPALFESLERTPKELCKRCGARAGARCGGCGEAFCKSCVDPSSASAPDVMCRECALRFGSPLLLEQVLGQCLLRLSAREATPLVRAMRKEAQDCQGDIDSWRTASPSPEVRAAMRERVLALHVRINELER